MSLIKLKNKNTVALVDTIGAQLIGLRVDGVDVLYNGARKPEKAQWGASAKNLFPNPGPVGTYNEEYGELETVDLPVGDTIKKHVVYHHNGGRYVMAQHGFAQYKEFHVQGQTDNTCLMSISHNDGTWSEYPYKFKYGVAMEINNDGDFIYSAFTRNDDNKPILAGMGWHPAFKLHGDPSRYKIMFKGLNKTDECELEEGELYTIDDIVAQGKSVKYSGIVETEVVLLYQKDNGKYIPYLSMHTKQPNLILWSKPATEKGQESFICIEPWNTTPRQIQKLTQQHKTPDLAHGDDPANIVDEGSYNAMVVPVKFNSQYIKLMSHHRHQEKE